MKHTGLVAATVLVLAIFSTAVFAAGGGYDLKKSDAGNQSKTAGGLSFLSYAEATKKAADEDKLVMLFFWASWCRYCTQIREEVFSLDRVKEVFDETYLAVSVNIEDDPENLTGRFRPSALPTLAFIRPNGTILGVLPGATSVDTFIEILEFVKTEAKNHLTTQ